MRRQLTNASDDPFFDSLKDDLLRSRGDEMDRLREANAELVKALRHIRLIVSPNLVGQSECDRLDDALAKAGEK